MAEIPKSKKQRPKGIFGLRVNSKNRALFLTRGDDEWSSDEEDVDFHPTAGRQTIDSTDSSDEDKPRRKRKSSSSFYEEESPKRRRRRPNVLDDEEDAHSTVPARGAKRNVTRKSYVESDDEGGRERERQQTVDSEADFVASLSPESDDDAFFPDKIAGVGTTTNNKKKSITPRKVRKKKTPVKKRPPKIDLTSDDDYDSEDYVPVRKKKTYKKRGGKSNISSGRKPAKKTSFCQSHDNITKTGTKLKTKSLETNGFERWDGASPRLEASLSSDQLLLGWRWANRLPLHVLVTVFEHVVATEGAVPFLLHAERISPLWDEAAQTASLWKKVDLTGGYVNLDAKKFSQLCRRQFSVLEELTLPSSAIVNEAIASLAEHCSSTLTSLSLPGCKKLKETTFAKWIGIETFPKLKALDLSELNQPRTAVLKPALLSLGPNLVSLNLSRNVIPSFPGLFQAIISACPALEFLDVSNIHGGDVLSFKVSQFQRGCPRLKTLRMAGWKLHVTDSAEEVADISGFPCLEDFSLAQTASTMSLTLPGSYNQVVRLLLAASNTLKLLDVRGLRGLSAGGLDVALLGPALHPALDKSPTLTHLFWSGVSKTDNAHACPLGSDMDFRQLLSSLRPTLATLDLSQSSFPSVHLDALCAAFERGYLPGEGPPLSELNLSNTNVEEDHIKRLLRACPVLNAVDLAGSRGLPRDMKKRFVGTDLDRLRKQLLSV